MSIRSISWSWRKWRKHKKHKKPASTPAPEVDNEIDADDDFLKYFRQYRTDKNALPDGWQHKMPPSSPTTFCDDSLSRDSGRSSGEVTDDSPLSTDARNLLPSRPWLDKNHFFNRPVDEFSEYSYSSPKDEGEQDSGVSSITTFDPQQHRSCHRAQRHQDLPDLWDAASAHSFILPLSASERRAGITNSVGPLQIFKWWLALLMSLLAVTVVSGSFWVNQLHCQQTGEKAFDINALAQKMNDSVFGQHLAVHMMMSLVKDFNRDESFPVVTVALLFGESGTGKSHVVNLVNEAFLYPSNVFRLSSTHPLVLADVEGRWSRSCGPSLLLVEDTEQLPPSQLEKIAQIAAERKKRLLILVTTNKGGVNLNVKTLEWMKSGKRHDINLSMVTTMLSNERVHLPPPVRVPSTSTLLIPFLPLTRDHVTQCIWKEVILQGGGNIVFTPEQVQWVLDQTKFFSKSFPLLATRGCKDSKKYVGVVIDFAWSDSRSTF